MNRRSSSQVGLFSAQISEQIQRLRTLTQVADGPTEAHQVDLRRAVMATRLLAGSARILSLESLHHFLDELLSWLQKIEQTNRALTSTQALILESVVELEEALMEHLDQARGQEPDLEPFAAQIQDLLQLIRHNAENLDPAEAKTSERGRGTLLPEVKSSLPEMVADHCARMQSEQDPEVAAELVQQAQEAMETLRTALERALDRGPQPDEGDGWTREVGDLAVLDDPASDPVIGPAVGRLKALADDIGFRFEVTAYGSGAQIGKSLRGSVGEILGVLVQDVAAAVRSVGAQNQLLRLTVEIRPENGRVRILIADNGPRAGETSSHGDADHLALFAGLRRARALLTQLRGLIRLEPAEDPDVRFELTVPEDLEHPSYVVVPLEGHPIAVPASLYETTLDAAGLLYEADEAGESVQHARRSIPLLDLGQYVVDVTPATDASAHIVVVGDVEKRLGLSTNLEPSIVRVDDLVDPPPGWELLAYAAVEFDGILVPVVDVRRLLQLRFRPTQETQLAGASADPMLEAFDRDDSSGPQTVGPASVGIPPVGRPRSALLVNQSEFRRRDLHRVLSDAGLEVDECEDLDEAIERLSEGRFDLLVTDLRLGQGASRSFADLRKQYRGLRVILTSSVAQQYAGELAGRTGADRCWLDPYRRSDLEHILRDISA